MVLNGFVSLAVTQFAFLPRKVLPVCVVVFSGHCDLTKGLRGIERNGGTADYVPNTSLYYSTFLFHDNSFPGRKQKREVSVI